MKKGLRPRTDSVFALVVAVRALALMKKGLRRWPIAVLVGPVCVRALALMKKGLRLPSIHQVDYLGALERLP